MFWESDGEMQIFLNEFDEKLRLLSSQLSVFQEDMVLLSSSAWRQRMNIRRNLKEDRNWLALMENKLAARSSTLSRLAEELYYLGRRTRFPPTPVIEPPQEEPLRLLNL